MINQTISNKKEEPAVFTNPKAGVVKYFDCYIPTRIEHVMRSADSYLSSTEFSFFIKCNIDWENRIVEVLEGDDDIFFPKQTVSSIKVDYKEDDKNFNGVIHKHPNNMTSFSATDDAYINSNFTVSLLWTETTGFCNGIINIPTKAGKVQIGLNIVEDIDDELDQNIINIVKEKATIETVHSNYKYSNNKLYSRNYDKYTNSLSFNDAWEDTDVDIINEDRLIDLESGNDDETNILVRGDFKND